MTTLLGDAVVNAIGHVLELPVAIVPATFVSQIRRAYCDSAGAVLKAIATVLVGPDCSLLPGLFLASREFSPLKVIYFYFKNMKNQF